MKSCYYYKVIALQPPEPANKGLWEIQNTNPAEVVVADHPEYLSILIDKCGTHTIRKQLHRTKQKTVTEEISFR